MHIRHISLTAVLALTLIHSGFTYAATRTPRTCSTDNATLFTAPLSPSGIGGTGHEPTIPPGGIGGTGHEQPNPSSGMGGTGHEIAMQYGENSGIGGTGHEPTIPPGGIGGTGHEQSDPSSGMGGTGHESPTPPGGIGGTGIVAAGSIVNIDGVVTIEDRSRKQIQLAVGDEICSGDRMATNQGAKAKILFADGAMLYILANTEINLIDYNYSPEQPEQSRSLIALVRGDIRSVSGKISKINPQNYSFKTPISTIHVIGTDFLVTHLPQQESALEAGTYAKVISGEISVQSPTSTIRLHAGESSHVMLNGTQSIISSGGESCSVP